MGKCVCLAAFQKPHPTESGILRRGIFEGNTEEAKRPSLGYLDVGRRPFLMAEDCWGTH